MARNLHSSDTVPSRPRRHQEGVPVSPTITSPSSSLSINNNNNNKSNKNNKNNNNNNNNKTAGNGTSASAHVTPSYSKGKNGVIRKQRSFGNFTQSDSNSNSDQVSRRKSGSARQQRSVAQAESNNNNGLFSSKQLQQHLQQQQQEQQQQSRRRRDSPTDTATTASTGSIDLFLRSAPARSASNSSTGHNRYQKHRNSHNNSSSASVPDVLYSPSCSDSTLGSHSNAEAEAGNGPRQQQSRSGGNESIDLSVRSTTHSTATTPVGVRMRRGTAAPTPVAALFTPSTPKTRDMLALGDALAKQQKIMNQTVVPQQQQLQRRQHHEAQKTPVGPHFNQDVSHLIKKKPIQQENNNTNHRLQPQEPTEKVELSSPDQGRQPSSSALKTPVSFIQSPSNPSPRSASPIRANLKAIQRRLVRRGKSTNSSTSSSSSSQQQDSNNNGFFQLKRNVSAPPLVVAPGPPPLEKRVRFSTKPPLLHMRTALSEREEANLYWTKKQVKQMLIRVQTMAREAWDQDRNTLLTCIHACYGFESQKANSSNINPHCAAILAESQQAKQLASNPQMALHYFCHYNAFDPIHVGGIFYDPEVDPTAPEDMIEKYLIGANSDHYPMIIHEDDYLPEPEEVPEVVDQQPVVVNEEMTDDNETLSTLRGLERHLSFAIVDYQMQCIHAVLKAQSQLRADEATPRQLAAGLAKQASHNSLPARKFARLLGKADAALVGTKNSGSGGSSQSKASSDS